MMSYLIITVCNRSLVLLLCCSAIAFKASGAGELSTAKAFLDREGEYHLSQADAHGTPSKFAIKHRSEVLKDGLFRMLEDSFYRKRYMDDAFHALGVMCSVEPEVSDFARLENTIEDLEKSEPFPRQVGHLFHGYVAASRFGFELSGDFFRKRISSDSDYWGDNLPTLASAEGEVTARMRALQALPVIGDAKAEDYANSLLDDEGITGAANLSILLITVLDQFEGRRKTFELERDYLSMLESLNDQGTEDRVEIGGAEGVANGDLGGQSDYTAEENEGVSEPEVEDEEGASPPHWFFLVVGTSVFTLVVVRLYDRFMANRI